MSQSWSIWSISQYNLDVIEVGTMGHTLGKIGIVTFIGQICVCWKCMNSIIMVDHYHLDPCQPFCLSYQSETCVFLLICDCIVYCIFSILSLYLFIFCNILWWRLSICMYASKPFVVCDIYAAIKYSKIEEEKTWKVVLFCIKESSSNWLW